MRKKPSIHTDISLLPKKPSLCFSGEMALANNQKICVLNGKEEEEIDFGIQRALIVNSKEPAPAEEIKCLFQTPRDTFHQTCRFWESRIAEMRYQLTAVPSGFHFLRYLCAREVFAKT